MKKKEVIYANKKQREFMRLTNNVKLFRAGRGTGKTFVIGHEKRYSMSAFPGGKGFIGAATYAQILTKTMPEVIDVWRRMGLKKDLHYVIGKTPPKWFKKPIKQPEQLKNVVSFYNGYCIELISMDRSDLSRGGSYDDGDLDEGLLMKWHDVSTVLIPTLRANRARFGNRPKHRQLRIYSSVAWKPRGFWINNFEDKVKEDPKQFGLVTAATIDNIGVLGLDYLEMLKSVLTPIQYSVEVLNVPITQLPNGFYHKFDAEKHCEASYEYNDSGVGLSTVKGDRYYSRTAAIDFSVDFGGRINCGIAMQHKAKDNTLRCLKEFYVKDNEKIPELVNQFCDFYDDHNTKHVRLWGEPRGHDRQADGEPYFDRMVALFSLRGWTCEVYATKTAEEQAMRHGILSDVFAESQYPDMPRVRVNDQECPNLVITFQTTGILPDFKKDKSAERDPDFPQERAPHLTDCFDNYFTQNYQGLFGRDLYDFMPNSID